jgi:NodT family efflux transporter outer membrane factor (OMF) lipoprotein
MNRLRPCMLVVTAALLGGCATGPDYERPAVQVPAGYKEGAQWKPAEPSDHVPRGRWWEIFGDSRLNGYMEAVEVSNQSLRSAEAQYRQARAIAQQSRASLFPAVTGALGADRSGSRTGVRNEISLGADATWEVDLWGRVRRGVESGEAIAQASVADLEAVRLSIRSDLAINYFQLRVLDAQKRLLEASGSAFETSLKLTRNRYAAGVAGRLDVALAETQLKSVQAQAIDIGVQRAQLEHAISVLLGRPPAEFSIESSGWSVVMPTIPTGLPSQLLERRPDIAAAERRTAAANAQIGVAQAALFPVLGLSASAGYSSSTVGNLLSASSRAWALGPTLALSIFDAGRRRALTDQAIGIYDQRVADYRQTVLNAFREVEDNLAALRILGQEATVQDEAVRSARETVVLTENQYKAGLVSYLNVVTVQNSQLNNERTAMGILGRQLSAAVLLVRALGGGWDPAAPPAGPVSPSVPTSR